MFDDNADNNLFLIAVPLNNLCSIFVIYNKLAPNY